MYAAKSHYKQLKYKETRFNALNLKVSAEGISFNINRLKGKMLHRGRFYKVANDCIQRGFTVHINTFSCFILKNQILPEVLTWLDNPRSRNPRSDMSSFTAYLTFK